MTTIQIIALVPFLFIADVYKITLVLMILAQASKKGFWQLFAFRNYRTAISQRVIQARNNSHLGSTISSLSLRSYSTESNDSVKFAESAEGDFVVRIMPRSVAESRYKKPDCRCDPQELLGSQSANQDADPLTLKHSYASKVIPSTQQELCKDDDEMLAVLEVKFKCPMESSTQAIHVDLHLNRNAQESAQQSLRRVEISMSRRIQRERNALLHHSHPGKERQLGSVVTGKSPSGSCTCAIMTRDVVDDGLDGDDQNDDDVSMEGYSPLNVDEMTSQELWQSLQNTNNSILSVSLDPNSQPIPLQISSCPPTIASVKTFENFGASAFVGVPLVVQTKVSHATRTVVSWFANNTEVCHDSPCYIPTDDDIGKRLSVLIVPIRPGHNGQGHEEAYVFGNLVEPLPFMPLVSPLRTEWMSRSEESREQDLRVMTYNLLADIYTSREVDQKLMYNHCPPHLLHKSRRMPMLVHEILAFHPDVVCLQEVDACIYETLFEPVLESQGYQGYYSNKASAQLEGCAMFWSLQCFKDAKEEDFGTYCIKDLFETESSPKEEKARKRSSYAKWESMDSIDKLLCSHDELRRVTTEKVGQVLQVATLTLKSYRNNDQKPDKLVVGNTHLFYHPMADHVRAMQAYVVCKQLDAVRHAAASAPGNLPPPLIMAGDFNSNPLAGALQVFLHRRLGPDHFETWKHLHQYNWEMGDYAFMVEHGYVGNNADSGEPSYVDEAFQDAKQYQDELEEDGIYYNFRSDDDCCSPSPPPIELPCSFPNLVSGYQEMPEFTNLAVDFSETLDYILASEPSKVDKFGFVPHRSAPFPKQADVKQYVAMPNEFMPSDHVSLVCDLKWTKHEDTKS